MVGPASSGLHEGLRGVLAEETTGTLWVCDDYGKDSAPVRFNLEAVRGWRPLPFPGAVIATTSRPGMAKFM